MGFASLFEDMNERFNDGEVAVERFMRDNPYEEVQEIGAKLRTLLRDCRESLNELRPIVELATDPGTDLAKENFTLRAQLDERDKKHASETDKLKAEYENKIQVIESERHNARKERDEAVREADVQRKLAEFEREKRRGIQASAGLSDDEVGQYLEDYSE